MATMVELELNLEKIIAESREVAQALNEFADGLERIKKKYAEPQESEGDNADSLLSAIKNGIPHETVTDFADKCKICGKQKKGKWIIIDDCEKFIAKCSECGQIEDSRMISKYLYCPSCGAEMTESEEGGVR